MVTPAQIHWDL